jgi:cytosine/adenosine deaminase-related metal-dependent hydrolase
MNPRSHSIDSFLRIDAAAAADGRGLAVGPVSVLVRVQLEGPVGGVPSGKATLEAIGTPLEVNQHPQAARSRAVGLPGHILVPGLVNAHTHLDLTHIGPRAYRAEGGFAGFVDLVRRERHEDPEDIATAVQTGVGHSVAGGVVAVGDIAGAPRGRPRLAAFESLLRTGLGGASFLEFFAIGKGEEPARALVSTAIAEGEQPQPSIGSALPLRFGIQPHAPTTVSLATYQWLLRSQRSARCRFSTHLAETPEEHEFIASASGSQRAFLESLGLWDDRMLQEIGHGRTPVEHMAAILLEAPFLCAHVNDACDRDIGLLARTPTSVAYCPRASDYFRAQNHFGPHRYRDMLAAGINVCLGTDSIINLPPGTDRLSTLDEMRFLYRRDKTDPVTLLRMATLNGAKALGLNEEHFSFSVGLPIAGLVAAPFSPVAGLSPLAAALSWESAPELLLVGK